MPDKTHYDLIILGAGPAGMTAGVYAARKQLDTLILTGDVGGQATWSSDIENYLGYKYITGTELVQKFEEHLRLFDVKIEFTKATNLCRANDVFEVSTEDGRTFRSRAVIIATGKSPRLLNVPGEKEFAGRGVTYCATCDGPLFAGMEVAVVGGGNSGLDALVQLQKTCPKVYLIEQQAQMRADEVMQEKARAAKNVEIILKTAVREIKGDTFVNGIVIENLDTGEKRDIPVKGVFVEVGLAPNSAVVADLLPLNEHYEIPVDCAARTEIPGLYAAGDVTAIPEKQIIIAAGDGAKAALGAYSYIVRLPVITDWGHRVTKCGE
ncbi:MAG: FAD-dependent oxidoreductase [Armatimonadetes bacterium]|nr:FAD-dependent oxidoreductase [Armatimonadota bacterium]